MGLLQTYQPKSLDTIIFRGHWWNPMFYVILTRTSTAWEHAVVVRGATGSIYDARSSGVNLNNLSRYAGRYAAILRRKDIDIIPMADRVKMIAFGDQLVKNDNRYDFLALLGFLTGIKAFEDEKRYYCAEVPTWMFAYNNWPLFNGEPKFVYPSDLYQNRIFDIIAEGVM
jgi:hypothetical protein